MNIQELITQVEKLRGCIGASFADPTDQAKFLKQLSALKRAIADGILTALKLEQSKPYRLDLLRFADLLKVNGRLDSAMITDVRLALQSMELESVETPHPYKLYLAEFISQNQKVKHPKAAAAKAYWTTKLDKSQRCEYADEAAFVRSFKRFVNK